MNGVFFNDTDVRNSNFVSYMVLHSVYKVKEIMEDNELSGSGVVWRNHVVLTTVELFHNYYNCTWATGFMNTAKMFDNLDGTKV